MTSGAKTEQADGASTQAAATHPDQDLTLRGWRLEAARVAWLAAAVVNGICFFAGLPRAFAIASDLSPASIARLTSLGLSPTFPAWYLLVLDTATFFLFTVVAIILFRRRAEDRTALVAAYMLSFTAMLYTAPGYEARVPVWMIAGGAAFAEYTQIAFLLVFPTGRFSPAWTRGLLLPLAVWRVAIWYFLYIPWLYTAERTGDNYPFLKQNSVDLLLFFAIVLFAVGMQIRRYRRESDQEARLQAKWLVWGTSIAVLIVGGYVIALNSLPVMQPEAGSAVLLRLAGRTVRQAALCIIPVAILISILRHRLWDIDFLINRTLVYVPLTSILAGVFAVSMALTQRFFVATTGQESSSAIVMTTLLLTAIFTPVRAELQAMVDRRFKDAPDPFKGLKVIDDQMEMVAGLIDRERLLKRLLEDTVRVFGANGGAVYLAEHGSGEARPRQVWATDGWSGPASLRLPISYEGVTAGWLALGPRLNGAPYDGDERRRLHESLERVADVLLLLGEARGEVLRLRGAA